MFISSLFTCCFNCLHLFIVFVYMFIFTAHVGTQVAIINSMVSYCAIFSSVIPKSLLTHLKVMNYMLVLIIIYYL